MIFTDRKITIRNGKSSINEPVILYRGDFEVSIRFTIMESKFRFKSGVNLVDSEKASFGQLAILTPYGGNVFSEIVKCEDGTVTFTLTKEMIDQLEEVGLYSFQIRLFDYYRESRVSIPPVEFGIEVREPVASEDHDNEVNNAIVGYSIAKFIEPGEEVIEPTFDADGNYIKTEWSTGDRITQGKLNRMEEAIDAINQNEITNKNSLSKQITSSHNILQSEIDELVLSSGESNLEVVQARNGETTLNNRLTKMENNFNDGLKTQQRDWTYDVFKGTKFIAHRGFSGSYPENTLKAYVEADRLGFDGWECDPFVSTDGVWFNMHDSTVDRTTNGSGNTASFTWVELDAMVIDGGVNAAKFPGLKIPTLEQIYKLASICEKKPLMFLNNRGATPLDHPNTKSMADIIRKYNYEERTLIFTSMSNFPGIRKELPNVGVIWDSGSSTPTDAQLEELASYRPNAMLSITYTILLGSNGPHIIDKCKELGILIQAHTVNDRYSIEPLIDLGVAAILTDHYTRIGGIY